MELVGPDMYVGMVCAANELRKMEEFMNGFMIKRT